MRLVVSGRLPVWIAEIPHLSCGSVLFNPQTRRKDALVTVMTVLGPIDDGDLGVTLPHEHFQLDLYRMSRSRDGYVDDLELAIEETKAFSDAGGRTIVDLTTDDFGRDPEMLARVAREANVNVIMGCGHYRNPYLPASLEKLSVRAVTEWILHEIEHGVGDTGIKPGVIGENGVEREWVTPIEERALRGAGRAQVQTGLPMSLHATMCPVGLELLTILEEEGVDLRQVVVSHCDNYPHADFHEAVAKRGAYVEFDRHDPRWGWEEKHRISLMRELADRGYLDRILMSHDICHKSERAEYGGPGYTYVIREALPLFHEAGFSDQELEMITVENPRRWLSGETG
jgi:predicted metal-dependent phosphotriesterase family hydrolase